MNAVACPDEADLLVLVDDFSNAELAAHVASCQRCRSIVDQFRTGVNILRRVSQAKPPAASPGSAGLATTVVRPATAVTAPTFIGRYFIAGVALKLPGATVYRAAHALLHTDVFLFLFERSAADELAQAALVQLARRIMALEHPVLLRVHDLEFDEGQHPCLVTDAVEGRTFGRVLEKRLLSLRDGAQLIVQLAGGVAVTHDQGLAHGLINTDVVFVEPWGEPRLPGIGLQQLLNLAGASASQATPAETSSELIKAQRADLASLARLLSNLLDADAAAGAPPTSLRFRLQKITQAGFASVTSTQPVDVAQWSAQLSAATHARRPWLPLAVALALAAGAIVVWVLTR